MWYDKNYDDESEISFLTKKIAKVQRAIEAKKEEKATKARVVALREELDKLELELTEM